MASKSTSLYGWCFLLAGMSSASGASLPFYGRAGHLFFSCQQLRLRYGRVVFPARHAGSSAVNHAQKRALCLGRRYEKMLLTHSFLFCCVSQPPPLRGTSFHRKEGKVAYIMHREVFIQTSGHLLPWEGGRVVSPYQSLPE